MNHELSAGQSPRMLMLAVSLGVALCAPAFAQTTIVPQSITPEMREAFNQARPYCEEDAAKFCRWTVPGGGRVVQCMVEHMEELSPACQQKIVEMFPQ